MRSGPVEVHRLDLCYDDRGSSVQPFRVWANPATGLPWSTRAALGWLRLVEHRGIIPGASTWRVSWTLQGV